MNKINHYILRVHWTRKVHSPEDPGHVYIEACMSVNVWGNVYNYTHVFREDEWQTVKERGWFEA